jgi:hypothetical protein
VLENALDFAIPFFMLTRSFRGKADQRQILAYLIMAGFLLSVIAAFEVLRHWPLYQAIDEHLGTGGGLSKTLAIRGGFLRSPGPYFESTTFGVLLALTTIATAALRSIFRSAAAHQFAILIGIFGTFGTLARNGWIGLALGLVLLGLYRGRIARTAALLVAAVAIFSSITIIAPKSGTFSALTGQSGHAATTSDYRERLLTLSIPLFKSSPLIGMPAATIADRLRSDLSSGKLDVDFVNSYIYFALMSGSIGLVIFVAFIWMPIVMLWNAPQRIGKMIDMEASGATFACLGALSMMVFLTSFAERVPLFAILLFGSARNIYLNLRNKRSDSARLARQALVTS